uniref:Fucolectin n=1 Tax=Magallana gigas TaxID=29159 RepID=A0A8W8NZS0_MAGGI
MEKVLCLMTVALIIAVADAGHQRSKRQAEPNIALKKPAKQSTTYSWAGESSPASLAVDGNNGTDFVVDKCSCTKGGDTNPWWLVDLQAVYHIDYVRILNRGMDKWGVDVAERLRDVTVTVGMTESDDISSSTYWASWSGRSMFV